jgi:hypothetical protein
LPVFKLDFMMSILNHVKQVKRYGAVIKRS